MSSLHIVNYRNIQMQLITERLVKTFQDIHAAISEQVEKLKKHQKPFAQNLPAPAINTDHQDNAMKMQSMSQKQSEDIVVPQQVAVEAVDSSKDQQKKLKINEEASPKKTQKKAKKVSSTPKPKKPLNSFKLFLVEMKNQASNKQDPQFINQVTKLATKRWQSFTTEEKKVYQDQQQLQTLQYNKKLQEYYNQHPQQRLKQKEKLQLKQQRKKQKKLQKQQQKQKQKTKQKNSKQMQADDNDEKGSKMQTQARIKQKAKQNKQLKEEKQRKKKKQKQADPNSAKQSKPYQKLEQKMSQKSENLKQRLYQIQNLANMQATNQNQVKQQVVDNKNQHMGQKQGQYVDNEADQQQLGMDKLLRLYQQKFNKKKQDHISTPLDISKENKQIHGVNFDNKDFNQNLEKPQIDQFLNLDEQSSDSLGGDL